MAAPKGNQFWKLRSKHGRDTLFGDSDKLWDAACEYFQWCVDNPLYEQEIVKGNFSTITDKGKESRPYDLVDVPKMRPFTLEGLCGYLDCSTAYFRNFKSQDRKNADDFITVITRIEEVIRNQQYSGSAAGFLNANLVARYLGISDKKEIEVTEITIDLPGED